MAEAKWPRSTLDELVRLGELHEWKQKRAGKAVEWTAEKLADLVFEAFDAIAASIGKVPGKYRSLGQKGTLTAHFASAGQYWIVFTYDPTRDWVVAQRVLHNPEHPNEGDIPTARNEFDPE